MVNKTDNRLPNAFTHTGIVTEQRKPGLFCGQYFLLVFSNQQSSLPQTTPALMNYHKIKI